VVKRARFRLSLLSAFTGSNPVPRILLFEQDLFESLQLVRVEVTAERSSASTVPRTFCEQDLFEYFNHVNVEVPGKLASRGPVPCIFLLLHLSVMYFCKKDNSKHTHLATKNFKLNCLSKRKRLKRAIFF
jgi:hypothetical protein